MTGGLVPHPAFQLLKSPNGLPMTTPWQVCALGQTVKVGAPAHSRPRPFATAPQYNRPRTAYESVVPAPPLRRRPAAVDSATPAYTTYPAHPLPPYSQPSNRDEDEEGHLRRIVSWMVWRVFPFCWLQAIGERIEEAGHAVRIMIAACCAGILLIALSHEQEAWRPITPEFGIGWGWVVGLSGAICGAWKGTEFFARAIFILTRLLALMALMTAVGGAIAGAVYLGAVLFGAR